MPEATVEVVRVHRPDVLVLDPGTSKVAFNAISAVSGMSGSPKVIIYTAVDSIELAVRAMDAGAAAYLTSGSTSDELLEAVQTVLGGDTFISPCVATKLIASLRTAALKKVAAQKLRLTIREEQIVGLLHKGKSNKEIAVGLGLSESTVKNYMTVLMQKLAAKSRLEVVLALKELNPATSPSVPSTFN